MTTLAARPTSSAGIRVVLAGVVLTLVALLAATVAVTQSKVLVLLLLALLAVPAGLFLLRHPVAIFWLLVISAPMTDHIAIGLGGINLRPYNLLAMAGLGWLAWMLARRQTDAAIGVARWLLPLFLPLIMLCMSKVVTVAVLDHFPPGMSRVSPLKFAVFAGLLFATAYVTAMFCDSASRLKLVLQVWIHLANLILFIGLFQLVASNTIGMHWVHHRDVIFYGRPFSVFREPDVLGSFFAATVFTVLPLIAGNIRLLPRRYLWLTLAAHGAFLVLIFVRAAWLAAIVAGGLWLLSLVRSRYLTTAIPYLNRLTLVCVLALMVAPVFAPSVASKVLSRFTSISKPKGESASEYRMLELNAMVEQSMPHGSSPDQMVRLLFGHGDFSWGYWGLELLGRHYAQEAYHLAKKGIYMAHPGYCMFLSVWFDNGIVGLTLYVTFFVLVAVRYIRVLGTALPANRPILMATALPCVCVLVCFQFSYDPIAPFFWVMMGLFLAALHHASRLQTPIVDTSTQELAP